MKGIENAIKAIEQELFAARKFYDMQNHEAYKISMIRVGSMLHILNMMADNEYDVTENGVVVKEA